MVLPAHQDGDAGLLGPGWRPTALQSAHAHQVRLEAGPVIYECRSSRRTPEAIVSGLPVGPEGLGRGEWTGVGDGGRARGTAASPSWSKRSPDEWARAQERSWAAADWIRVPGARGTELDASGRAGEPWLQSQRPAKLQGDRVKTDEVETRQGACIVRLEAGSGGRCHLRSEQWAPATGLTQTARAVDVACLPSPDSSSPRSGLTKMGKERRRTGPYRPAPIGHCDPTDRRGRLDGKEPS
ncbi:hypothetical protein PCL_07105 [Purpureocillium lilacinum]|uniref:Uncharacterized protein n=1 Tax=Purpureocillium lilacinum TaxID=33203 RepID=A0A2U3DSW7_PURLI|nr:hypothetical protein Purlil1_11447 [Purpureocillium lilacinum]PWI65336.1 hypothetical protein PCL_07105 [Purpureocillium lilacinum]